MKYGLNTPNYTRVHEDDQRRRGRGGGLMHGEGRGACPVGWLEFDYEQANGYSGRTWAYGPRGAYPWANEGIDSWSYDEVGVYPLDLTDEMEDWDEAPYRGPRHSRNWDLEADPVTVPSPEMIVKGYDPYVENWVEEQKAKGRLQRLEEEEALRRQQVNAERRNITAMQRAARDKILERVAEGKNGKYEVLVRKSNQTLRWEYVIKDGTAFIKSKRLGWVRLSERR